MKKVYLVIGQKNKVIHPVAVFAKEGEAEASANNYRTDENDYWVEELNYHE